MRLSNYAVLVMSLLCFNAWAVDGPATNVSASIQFASPTAEQSKELGLLEKTPEFKANECQKVLSKSAKGVTITCAKFDGLPVNHLAQKKLTNGMSLQVAACPADCYLMNCPPPIGPVACCRRTSTSYQVCATQ